MAVQLYLPVPMSRAQLRRLQALWHQWTRSLQLERDADRELRHYYIERFTDERARTTKDLSNVDAARVIERLERLVDAASARYDDAAGLAGRHGYPEWRRVPPTAAAWQALWFCVRELGMDRGQLDYFIRRHYIGRGLRGLADVHSMADLNRVLWGLKAILRRGPGPKRAAGYLRKKAA